MSRDLYVSAVDLEQLCAVQGSGNEALLASILERNQDYIAEHDEYFRGFPGVPRYAPLEEALKQIVRGQIDPDFTPRFQFEHATALLADSLGERLDANLFAECTPAFWDEVDTLIGRRLVAAGQPETAWPALAQILERGPCLNIPLDLQWRLGSGYLTTGEVSTAAKAAEACELVESDNTLENLKWPEEALEAASQYRDWLRHAGASGVGLYFRA